MPADLTIVTFREIFQYEAKKKGRYTDDYRNRSTVLFLDRQDLAGLGIKDGSKVRVENRVGTVVLTAKLADDDSHQGIAFMVESPWSNQLLADDACQASGLRRISARVTPTNEPATEISEIFKWMKA
jgi:formylmethanofuran dehydrogenase subunit D